MLAPNILLSTQKYQEREKREDSKDQLGICAWLQWLSREIKTLIEREKFLPWGNSYIFGMVSHPSRQSLRLTYQCRSTEEGWFPFKGLTQSLSYVPTAKGASFHTTAGHHQKPLAKNVKSLALILVSKVWISPNWLFLKCRPYSYGQARALSGKSSKSLGGPRRQLAGDTANVPLVPPPASTSFPSSASGFQILALWSGYCGWLFRTKREPSISQCWASFLVSLSHKHWGNR